MVQKFSDHQLRLVVYPVIYKVLAPSKAVGNGISEPLTVCKDIYSPKVLKSWPLGWVSFLFSRSLFKTTKFWHNSHRAQSSAVASPSVLQRGSKSNSVLKKSEPQFVSPDFSCHQKVLRVELTTSKKEHLLPMRKLYEIRAFFSVSLVFNWGHPNSEIRTW